MTIERILSLWHPIRVGLLETAHKFTDRDLAFQPYIGSWDVGQTLCHIAKTEAGWLHFAVGNQIESWPSTCPVGSHATIKSILRELGSAHQTSLHLLATWQDCDLERQVTLPDSQFSPTVQWVVWHVIEHEIHHRGELSLILGMLGREGLNV